MSNELNTEIMEAISVYNDILNAWTHYWKSDDFVTFLDTRISNKEALYMFFKIHRNQILNNSELMASLGGRQITNKYLRVLIMEFKLSEYFRANSRALSNS